MFGDKLGLSGLNGKIALSKSYFFFFGISILSNEIASVAGKHEILNLTLPSLTDSYHFRDLTKMIIHIDSLRFTGFYGSTYGNREVLPSCISQQFLKFSSEPHLNLLAGIFSAYILLNAVK